MSGVESELPSPSLAEMASWDTAALVAALTVHKFPSRLLAYIETKKFDGKIFVTPSFMTDIFADGAELKEAGVHILHVRKLELVRQRMFDAAPDAGRT